MPHLLPLPTSISLADPTGSSPIVAAVLWLQGTLLGTIATTLAVVAVAWVGLLMLTGRIELRRGVSVVVGCFILFGASSIAAGIQSAASSPAGTGDPEIVSPSPSVIIPPSTRGGYDPYAGASVPRR